MPASTSESAQSASRQKNLSCTTLSARRNGILWSPSFEPRNRSVAVGCLVKQHHVLRLALVCLLGLCQETQAFRPAGMSLAGRAGFQDGMHPLSASSKHRVHKPLTAFRPEPTHMASRASSKFSPPFHALNRANKPGTALLKADTVLRAKAAHHDETSLAARMRGRVFLWLSVLAAALSQLAQKSSRILEESRRSLLRAITAMAAVFALLFAPPALAAELCLPCPSPQGMGRICIELRQDTSPHPPPSRPAATPDHINAQRTPTGADGTFLSRAGFRPLTMFQDGWARVQAAARYRLELLDKPPQEWIPNAAEIPEGSLLSFPPGPERRRAILESEVDVMAALFGGENIPRSQLVAEQFDPIFVFAGLTYAAVVFNTRLGRMLRWVVLPHHRAKNVTILLAQVGVSGDDALRLSRSCRCLAQHMHDAISPLHITADGPVEIDNPRPGAGALSPTVRYASLLLNNATRSPGFIHGRVEAATWPAGELEDARDCWEEITSDEILRGLPKREFPHKPGEFQYGAPDECPKPGPAGFGLQVLPKWLDLSIREDKEFEEVLWRMPRRNSPVGLAVIHPPLRNTQEQELLEDRRAANLDKLHRAQYGKSGGYLRRLQEERIERKGFLETEEQWLEKNESANMTVDYGDDDDWINIRDADFAEEYTKNYGSAWQEAMSQESFEAADRDHNESVAALRAWYRAEMGGAVNVPSVMGGALSRLEPDMKQSSGVQAEAYQGGSDGVGVEWTEEQVLIAKQFGLSDDQVTLLKEMDGFDPAKLSKLTDVSSQPAEPDMSLSERNVASQLGLSDDDLRLFAMLEKVAPELLQDDEDDDKEEEKEDGGVRGESDEERARRTALVSRLMKDQPELELLEEMRSNDELERPWAFLSGGGPPNATVSPDDLKILGGSNDGSRDPDGDRNDVEMESPEVYAKSMEELMTDAADTSDGRRAVPEMLDKDDVSGGDKFKYTPGLQSSSRLGVKKFFKPLEEYEREMEEAEARAREEASKEDDATKAEDAGRAGAEQEEAKGDEAKDGGGVQLTGEASEANRRATFKVEEGDWESAMGDIMTKRDSMTDSGTVNRSGGMVLVTAAELLGPDAKKEDLEAAGTLMLEEWQWEMLQYNPTLKARVKAQLLQRMETNNGSLTSGSAEGGRAAGEMNVTLSNGTIAQEQAALDEVLHDMEDLVTAEDTELTQATSAEEVERLAKEGGWRQARPAVAGGEGGPTGRMWVREPHSVVTVMVMLAQPDSGAARRLLESAERAEAEQSVAAFQRAMQEMTASDAIPGNVIAVELLWTAEPEDGFELEDIMTRRRLQSLYPELFPVEYRAKLAEEAEEARRKEEEEELSRKAFANAVKRDKEMLRQVMGGEK